MKKWSKHFKLATAAAITSISATLIVTSPSASVNFETTQLELPPLQQGIFSESVEPSNTPQLTKKTILIQPGDSLAKALDRVGVSARTTHEISQTHNAKWLTNLQIGDQLDIWLNADNTLQKIDYPKSAEIRYQLLKENDQFRIQKQHAEVETTPTLAMAKIEESFYLAGQKAGLSAKSIMNLADIFAWDIDFIRELRHGDHLKVIYEKRFIDGEYIGDGDILAAEITSYSGRESHKAFLLRDGNKNIGYYDEKGGSLRKQFLRNPVDVVRITSRFNPKRFHPVLKKWKAHRGVDYGGPIGTPVKATGKGKIIKRGWGPGYGRYIKIRHQNNYTTVYGHFSKFGKYKQGQWVDQGDVIGYIGKSGRATGPHLHYEFRINNKHVDPLKLKFPAAGPVAKKHRKQYLKTALLMQNQLDRLETSTHVASYFE
jgi:murein DD-endopeptidase MepM/ murein hydrolase activator NlpD